MGRDDERPPVTERETVEPEPLDAGLDDVMDVFPDGEQVHTPPSEADSQAPG